MERDWREALVCLPEAERDAVMMAIRNSQASGVPFACEHRVRHADGSEIWVHNRGDVVERDSTGRPLRMVGSLRDVTQDRQAALVMQRRNRILQAIAAVNELLMADLPATELMACICEERLGKVDRLYCSDDADPSPATVAMTISKAAQALPGGSGSDLIYWGADRDMLLGSPAST